MHNSCLLCNSKRLKPLKNYESADLVQCVMCSFVFSRKEPSTEELVHYYSSYPRNHINLLTQKRYEELLDNLEKFRKHNNILDVGCGDGYFLEAAKKRGWSVYGTEFTEEAVRSCTAKGVEMKLGKLASGFFKAGFFDVITSFEVIEHINNPAEEMMQISTLLRNDGVMYITTPNFNAVSRKILKGKWNVICYPEHLSYYTPKTLKQLLTANQFQKVKVETTGISFDRFLNSRSVNHEQKNALSPKSSHDQVIREKMESSLIMKTLKYSVNFCLKITKSGDTIKALFQKKQ